MLSLHQIVYTTCSMLLNSYTRPKFIEKYQREYPVRFYQYKIYTTSVEITKILILENDVIYITPRFNFHKTNDGSYRTCLLDDKLNVDNCVDFKTKEVFLSVNEADVSLSDLKNHIETTWSNAKVTEIKKGGNI